MNTIGYSGQIEIIAVGIEPGEMLLESIEEAIRKHDIQNGVVVSGIGTLSKCHLHHIEDCGFPPKNRFFVIEKPLELSAVSGLIVDGKPHLHVVVSYRDEETYSGHLEPGSEVLYLAEIAIMKCNGMSMIRERDTSRHISLLKPA